MNTSNLARRLDEPEAVENEVCEEARQSPPRLVVAESAARPAPRRLTLHTRRILIRDCGLRPFRVF